MAKKHHKATGGPASNDPAEGSKLYEADLKDKPTKRVNAKEESEAEEKKHGGKAKHRRHRRHGGGAKHHEGKMHTGHGMQHAKHVGPVRGKYEKGHKGKSSRSGGGKTGSNFNPLSSAHHGSQPSGHKSTDIE